MADVAAPAGLSTNIKTVQFKVYNRVAATRPVQQVLGLLLPSSETTPNRLVVEPEQSDADDPAEAPAANAFLHIASAAQPDVFGIRVGMHISDSGHLLVVDAAVEYEWSEPVVDYTTTDIEEFVRTEAAPRAAISAWTLVEELARSAGAELNPELTIPIQTVVHSTLQQVPRKQ